MWFTRDQFALCNELRIWGLEPRFEPGDIVARGFADLGYEEFQVLPGPALLSLTAGTVSRLPEDHQDHFFWIPSVDECVTLLESHGAVLHELQRVNGREWVVGLHHADGSEQSAHGESLHDVMLQALHELLSSEARETK
jgi:hypothetical protein